MLSSMSGMLRSVARSSRCTTIFSLPFDLSISFLASIRDRFSVTVPFIYEGYDEREREIERERERWREGESERGGGMERDGEREREVREALGGREG